MLETIRGTCVPRSSLPFSPAIKAGHFVFVSGQASVDGEGRIVEDTFAEEMRRSFNNVRFILEAAGLGLQHIVKVCAYVANQSDLEEYNAIYRGIFSPPYPARTTLIGCLGTLLKFEVDVIAFADESTSAHVGEKVDE